MRREAEMAGGRKNKERPLLHDWGKKEPKISSGRKHAVSAIDCAK